MDRRAFLGLGASTGLVAALPECAPVPRAVASGPSPVTPRTPAPHAELEEATLASLGARMQRGEITSAALVEAYLARIEAIDRAGPVLRSVLELNPDAPSIAAGLDTERRQGRVRGPLHGIPVLVKDNVDTGDRMQTTAGSLALMGAPAPRDATLVARLRAAGAVILGKTNLSEWANIRDSHSVSGWSARGGLTRNPYALDRNTSGSSSGSAAAIAASLCAVGVGTETNGSIMSPSSIQGLVGIKPTVGVVSRTGVIPISHTQDTAGPMARTVRDAAMLLDALASLDPEDPPPPGTTLPADYTASLDLAGARGKRIGVVRPGWMGPSVKPSFEAAIDTLRHLGAVLHDLEPPKPPPGADDAELTLLLYELKAGLTRYLARRGHPTVRTLEDVLRFNAAHAAEELAVFGQDLFEKAATKGDLSSKEYFEAFVLCQRYSHDEGLDRMLGRQQMEATPDTLDAIVVPTGGPAWLTDYVNGDSFTGSGYDMAAIAGYPSVTVPSGATRGLPLGVCFMGTAWSEPTLLAIAFAFEQETHHRRPPTYAPTSDYGLP